MKKRAFLKRVSHCFAGIAFGGLAISSPISAEEKAQKTILFLGDSITAAGGYVRAIETELNKTPKTAPRVVSRGKPSETVSGLSEEYHPGKRPYLFDRLDEEIEKAKPDWVVACYGMNCGIYHPFEQSRFEAYQAGIKKLMEKTHAAGAYLILLTPPPYAKSGPAFPEGTDQARQQALLDEANQKAVLEAEANSKRYGYRSAYAYYDKVLEKYATWLLSLNEQKNVRVVDLRAPMLPHLKETHGGDPIHPNKKGHQIMAEAFLKEWPEIRAAVSR